MKKLLVVLVLALGILFLFAPPFAGAQNERSGEQAEAIAKRKPAATSTGPISSSVTKPAKVLDGSIDVTMGRGVTRSFKNVRIGDFHPETYYFEEILEKPDFMTFKTDAVKKVISPSPSRTVVDFTLTSAADAPLGDFTIRVKYTFHFGGPALTDEILTVNLTIADIPKPAADFTGVPASGPIFLSVQFTDMSTGVIEGRLWDFGDGFTSTATNPSHLYTTVGTYTVKLTVDGPGGTDTKTRENYITTTERPPVANFTATPTFGTKPLTVQFTDQSTGTITDGLWSFGDGQTSTRVFPGPVHTYTNAGTYTVSLTVTGPGGSDTETKTNYVTVREPTPVADFEGTPTSGLKPLTVQLTDKSSGPITEWSWAFGDGGTSKEQNPSHTYTNAGTFTVALVVRGPGGSDTKTRSAYITVNEPRPTADFSGSPTSGQKPLGVQFSDKSTGVITVRLWDFGDGQKSSSTNPSHTYTGVGSYTVTLIAAGPGGSDTTTKANYITVTEPPPVANFTAVPRSGVKPLAVQFTNTSTGQYASQSWNFGDGQTSTETNPSHTYAGVGTYTVSLTVTGPGGSNTKTEPGYIIVSELAPVADFTAVPTSGKKPLTIQFINSSTGVITGYAWNFGDGQTSTEKNPSHVYNDAGTYTVSLTVAGPGGSHTMTRENYIAVNTTPVVANVIPGTTLSIGGAAFTRDLNAAPAVFTDPDGDALSYTASSSNPAVAGAVISGSSLTVSPVAAGSAAITIMADDGKEGMASTVFNVQVLPAPPAAPELVSPLEAAVISADSVRFVWRRSGPAVNRYWFELATDSLLTNPAVDSTLGAADTTRTGRKLSNNQTYWWRVSARNAAGWGSFSAVRKFHIVMTSVHARDEVPSEFRLSQNYPNPFNPSTIIEYALPQLSHVDLKVYDVLGNEVRVLVSGKQPAGVHHVQFDSEGLPGGVYFYRLRAGEKVEMRKMVVVR